jgi:hypothetical protein
LTLFTLNIPESPFHGINQSIPLTSNSNLLEKFFAGMSVACHQEALDLIQGCNLLQVKSVSHQLKYSALENMVISAIVTHPPQGQSFGGHLQEIFWQDNVFQKQLHGQKFLPKIPRRKNRNYNK